MIYKAIAEKVKLEKSDLGAVTNGREWRGLDDTWFLIVHLMSSTSTIKKP
jgi:hypothetical protein